MRIVDTQCHVSTVWYEPAETLLAQMDRSGVDRAVLIQMLGELDNSYQQACVARFPDRFASVVAVEASVPVACTILSGLAADGAAGVRLRPDARSPGDDPLAIWRCAADLGLPVSCVGTAEKFGAPAFFDLIAALPALTIVLEHLGGTSQSSATELDARKRVFALAEFPNVYLKLPGLGELIARPGPSKVAALDKTPGLREETGQGRSAPAVFATPIPEIELALESFGPDRLMWGSDFPVVCGREGYANALGWARHAVASAMPDAEARVFGGTARRVFRLN
ncbi:MAG TPA: amidohydrolase family protein [Gammaproteobacteria bacterium]|nr:amidohydrolase family protein [Gammaproteobacteria bacterium]